MSKNNSFIKGAAILSLAGIIVKILGALYRIPLANIIKDEGMGYYQTAYPFYILLLTISTSGFPIAIAKLVSEKRAMGDYRSSYKVFRVALIGLSLGGILSSLFVFIKGEKIVRSIGNVRAYYSLIALVPALLFVPIMSAFRGFFQGRQDMLPTALSQIVEQLSRLISGFYFTYLFIDYGIAQAAGGATLGGSVGALLGLIFIFFIYLLNKNQIRREISKTRNYGSYPTREVVKDLLTIALPITIGASIIPIMDTIDASIVIKRLESINYTRSMANELYGQLKGFAQTLVNLPQVFSLAIAMSLVPVISAARARNNHYKTRKIIEEGIRITLLIGLPSGFGLFVLSKPIINLLYYNNSMESIVSAGEILASSSFGIIFLTLVQTSTAILQGLDKPLKPVLHLLVGAIVKLKLTYILTSIVRINIKGAAISTVLAYAIAATLNLITIRRKFKVRLNYKKVLIQPLLISLTMAFLVKLSYIFFIKIISERFSTILSIALGGLIYVILLLITGTITREDLYLLPRRSISDKMESKI